MIATIKALPQSPDCIVVTGDLANDGEAEAYALFRDRMNALQIPWYAIPGNHDVRAGFPQSSGPLPQVGPGLAFSEDLGPVRLILLDTLIEGQSGGQVGPEQLAWLETVLDGAGPRLIAMHHPPVRTRIGGMDLIGLADADAFWACLKSRDRPRAILCGHVHRTIFQLVQDVPVIIGPAPVNAVDFSLFPPEKATWRMEPPAFLLHAIEPEGHVTTHQIPVGREAMHQGAFADPHTHL